MVRHVLEQVGILALGWGFLGPEVDEDHDVRLHGYEKERHAERIGIHRGRQSRSRSPESRRQNPNLQGNA